MDPRKKEKLAGILIATIGLGVSYAFYEWSVAQAGTHAFFIIEATGPIFAVLGMALIFFPSYRLERLSKGEDISSFQGMALLTPRWWIILGVTLIVELLYLYGIGVFAL